MSAHPFGLGDHRESSNLIPISIIYLQFFYIKKIFKKHWFIRALQNNVSLLQLVSILSKSKKKNHI